MINLHHKRWYVVQEGKHGVCYSPSVDGGGLVAASVIDPYIDTYAFDRKRKAIAYAAHLSEKTRQQYEVIECELFMTSTVVGE